MDDRFIGWGIGTSGAQAANDKLEAEVSPTIDGRVPCAAMSAPTGTAGIAYRGAIVSTSSLAITEAGLFDAAGNLLIRGDFAPLNISGGESIIFTFKLDID